MFGFGNKKKEAVVQAAPEAVEADSGPKEVPYDLESEVTIHIMPTKFKQVHASSQAAQKTGMFIMVIGGFFVLATAIGIGWLFMARPNNKIVSKPASVAEESVATATDSVVIPKIAETPVDSAPVISTDVASSSVSTGEVATTSEVVVENIATPVSVVATSTDTDSDILNDSEELLLGTDSTKTDSDGDTFTDGDEVARGYNPVGGGKLELNKNIAVYSNSNFSLIYPKAWQFKSTGNDAVSFWGDNNQFFSVGIQPNMKSESIIDWFKREVSPADILPAQFIDYKNASNELVWQGLSSVDGLSYYITDTKRQNIITINYNLGTVNSADYINIFKSAVKSFRIKY